MHELTKDKHKNKFPNGRRAPKEKAILSKSSSEIGFGSLVWSGVRPYMVMIVKDFIISCLLWFALWAFHLVTELVKNSPEVTLFVQKMHEIGIVLAYGLFIGLFLLDIYQMHIKGHSK